MTTEPRPRRNSSSSAPITRKHVATVQPTVGTAVSSSEAAYASRSAEPASPISSSTPSAMTGYAWLPITQAEISAVVTVSAAASVAPRSSCWADS